MIKYNLCLMKRGNQILLLNREKPSWMGCWNGIGGKVEPGERPRAAMIREIAEETDISDYRLRFRGLVTWMVDGTDFGGMYLYAAEVPTDYEYSTPIRMDEGILDWKPIDWIMHPHNMGIATNIPRCLEYVLKEDVCYDHHCIYVRERMVEMISTAVRTSIEENMDDLNQYLARYF
ncbi:8-oxo-dGTP diphosphatase [Paenibacillus sp. WST5]|uniref:8-oxo-dGTP diphosphatase n=2 Tax=Paenibacillus sedimenti TaxID=2770274 RepID=A0A926KVT2_9BACL|nr:8-oxo-dGTP diphosphatase [Paenibacillus sedimenti]